MIEIKVEQVDILEIQSDVVVLKYAQDFYGADKAVAKAIFAPNEIQFTPSMGGFTFLDSNDSIGSKQALYIDVPPLNLFSYSQIREFSRKAMEILKKELPDCHRIAMTIHGVRMGLDEVECVLSQLGGLFDAIYSDNFPASLESIIFVEINPERAERIENIIKKGLFIRK